VIDTAIVGDNTSVSCSYRDLAESVTIGSKVLIDNGALEMEVTSVTEGFGVYCEVKSNYILGENRPMHLPGAPLTIESLGEKDPIDIKEFGIKYGVDMIALSLVRTE